MCAKNRVIPIAQLLQRLLYQRMGVIGEVEQVNKEGVDCFVALFQEGLPDIVSSSGCFSNLTTI